jgi:hypothetical protein
MPVIIKQFRDVDCLVPITEETIYLSIFRTETTDATYALRVTHRGLLGELGLRYPMWGFWQYW